ncbi:MAG: hypothetical protein ACHWZW_11455 [Spirulina sp.]
MTTIRAMPPWMFSLDGTFLGFGDGGSQWPKHLHLDVDGEVLAIQIRRELRPLLNAQLQPGDRLRCIGRSQIHSKTGMIALKANHVFRPETPSGG